MDVSTGSQESCSQVGDEVRRRAGVSLWREEKGVEMVSVCLCVFFEVAVAGDFWGGEE